MVGVQSMIDPNCSGVREGRVARLRSGQRVAASAKEWVFSAQVGLVIVNPGSVRQPGLACISGRVDNPITIANRRKSDHRLEHAGLLLPDLSSLPYRLTALERILKFCFF